MSYVAKARYKLEIGRNQRLRDIQKLGFEYVLERDKILQARGLDPVADSIEYEEDLARKQVAYEQSVLWQQLSVPQEPQASDTDFSDISEISKNAAKVEELLQTKTVPEVIQWFDNCWRDEDYPPMFQEFANQDQDNLEMQHLSTLFEMECGRLAVDFLRRHADKVSKKALVGFAGANICDAVFDRMFRTEGGRGGNNNNN